MLIQIGMQYFRTEIPLLVPWQFTEHDILRVVHNPSDPRVVPLLYDILQSRDFARLWTNPVIKNALTNFCILCGASCFPGEIWLHLVEPIASHG